MNRRLLTHAAFTFAVLAPVSAFAGPIQATLYKDPSCSCCQSYADYLNQNGFKVTVVPSPNLEQITRQAGVPASLDGCHLTKLDGYLIEGHVPAPIIKKLLTERPPIKGIAIAGMPAGVPGMPAMEGMNSGPINVYEISPSTPVIYATIN